jgi:hypothetical protein
MLTVELRVEGLGAVSEPPERSGFTRKLSRGLLAPLQIGRLPLVLFAPTGCVALRVLRELVEVARAEQLAFAQLVPGAL